jgi:hypothetical protein
VLAPRILLCASAQKDRKNAMSMFYERLTSAQMDSVQAKDVIFDKQNDGVGQHLITAALGAPPPPHLYLSCHLHTRDYHAHPHIHPQPSSAGTLKRGGKSLWHLMHRSYRERNKVSIYQRA